MSSRPYAVCVYRNRLITEQYMFIFDEVQDGAKVTLSKKIEYLHYSSSKRADIFYQ